MKFAITICFAVWGFSATFAERQSTSADATRRPVKKNALPRIASQRNSRTKTGASQKNKTKNDDTENSVAIKRKLKTKLSNLQRAMAPVTGIDADFKQLKKLSIFSKTLLITGKMTIRTPHYFKWEISTPLKSSLVVDGDNVSTWDEEANEKITMSLKDNPVAGSVWTQMDAFFMGRYDKLGKLYDIELITDSPLTLRFKPWTKPLSTIMKNVILVFGEINGRAYLKKVVMIENGGDSTTIDFMNVKLRTAKSADKNIFNR